MQQPQVEQPIRVIGRYALYGQLAAGGMATVHFGRLLGPAGFSRTVAVKRLHPQFSKDPEFVAMFLDEARLAARIQHPNVVATVDVVAEEQELFLVMDYIRGESFSRVLRGSRRMGIPVDPAVIGSVVCGMLQGLHAAHEARDEQGQPLSIVHRDVSPQNVLVGIDGVARVLDFGVAKAAARLQVTRDGQMKGKLCYMAPEQLKGQGVDRRTDVFAGGIVLWEALTGRRLFEANEAGEILKMILTQKIVPPSTFLPGLAPEVDAVVLRALSKDPNERFQTAREFAIALEEAVAIASPRAVGDWVELVAGDTLASREMTVAEIESVSSSITELSDVDEHSPELLRTLEGLGKPGAADAPSIVDDPNQWDEGPTNVFEPGAVALPAPDATRVHVPRPSKPSPPSSPFAARGAADPVPSVPASNRRRRSPRSSAAPPLPSRPASSGRRSAARSPEASGPPSAPAVAPQSTKEPGAPTSLAQKAPAKPISRFPPRLEFGDEDEPTTLFDPHAEAPPLDDYDETTALFDPASGAPKKPRDDFEESTAVYEPSSPRAAEPVASPETAPQRARSTFPTPRPAAGRAAGASSPMASAGLSTQGSGLATIIVQDEDSADDFADVSFDAELAIPPMVDTGNVIEVTQPGLARRNRRGQRRLMAAGAAVAVVAFATAFWIGRMRSVGSDPAREPTPVPVVTEELPAPEPVEPASAEPEPEALDPSSLPVATEETEPEAPEPAEAAEAKPAEPAPPPPVAAKPQPKSRAPRVAARPRAPVQPSPPAPAAASAPSPALDVTLEEEKPSSAPAPAPNLESPYAAELRARGLAAPSTPSKPPECEQPYEVDEQGIRRLKPACL